MTVKKNGNTQPAKKEPKPGAVKPEAEEIMIPASAYEKLLRETEELKLQLEGKDDDPTDEYKENVIEIPYSPNKTLSKNPPLPNSLIVRYENGRYKGRFEYIENPVGMPYTFQGRDLYWFTLHTVKDKPVLRVLRPSERLKMLPEALWRSLHSWEGYRKLTTTKKTAFEKVRLGIALALVALMTLAMFLIISSSGG